MSKKTRKRTYLLALLALALLTACGSGQGTSQRLEENSSPQGDSSVQKSQASQETGTWVSYWDYENYEQEYKEGGFDSLVYFAAYFDQDWQLFVPEELLDQYRSSERASRLNYLSFVNDRLLPEGGSILKDPELLYARLSDKEKQQAHIEEIISMVKALDFDGIEIDYEGIKGDQQLWLYFMEFIEGLNKACQEEGLALRVVLEPAVVKGDRELVEGPTYVLMCYNLYGIGTEAGPKADRDFLEGLVSKGRDLSDKMTYALAAGGFDFSETGEVQSLREKEALELLALYGQEASRDAASQALTFLYEDLEGVWHEVWYADGETLAEWARIIQSLDPAPINIWKLGGNLSLASFLAGSGLD